MYVALPPFYRYGALSFKRLDHKLYFPGLQSRKIMKSVCLLRDFFYIVPHMEHVASEDINIFGKKWKFIFASIILLLLHIKCFPKLKPSYQINFLTQRYVQLKWQLSLKTLIFLFLKLCLVCERHQAFHLSWNSLLIYIYLEPNNFLHYARSLVKKQ